MMQLRTISKIQIMPDGEHFRLDGDLPAVIIPASDRSGRLCDFVAYDPNDPDRWYLREGYETPILGARELAGASIGGGPIPLYPRPCDWLDAGGHGVCVLMWDMPLFDLFRDVDIDLSHLEKGLANRLYSRLWENLAKSLPRIRRRSHHDV